MRFPVFLLFLIIPAMQALSQGARPQNIYRVTVTSRYVLDGHERTSNFFTVNQEIYDSLGRLHTEVDYNWETRYPDHYRWHYYDSMLIVRTEHYSNEKLDRRVVFEYAPDMLVARELHYNALNDDSPERIIEYSYNAGRLPARVNALNNRGRKLYSGRFQYDDRGTEVRRRLSGRGAPDDGIRRLDREVTYDSLGRINSEKLSLRMTDGSRRINSNRYQYDREGNIIGLVELDGVGNQLRRVEYVWQSGRNRLQRIIIYNADDKLEMYLAKRYEIYRSDDRRQRVIDY
jgi:hypothetical protein